MRPVGAAEELEKRRRYAVRLVEEEGHTLAEAAELVGATEGAVCQWRKRFREAGEEGLRAKPVVRARKLDAAQKAELLRLLEAGPEKCGLGRRLWSSPLVTRLILEKFDVSYHPDHVGRLLHALGYTPQMPKRVARERDPAAVERWRKRTWPRLKKGGVGGKLASCSSTKRASSRIRSGDGPGPRGAGRRRSNNTATGRS